MQTSHDTCEGVSTVNQCNKDTIQPSLPGLTKSHTDEDTKTLIFRVGDFVFIQKRCLHIHGSWDV